MYQVFLKTFSEKDTVSVTYHSWLIIFDVTGRQNGYLDVTERQNGYLVVSERQNRYFDVIERQNRYLDALQTYRQRKCLTYFKVHSGDCSVLQIVYC